MLLFSTMLNIKENVTKDDFIQLAIEWNQGSIHEENIIPNIEWNGERNIRFGEEGRWLQIEEYRNKNIVAIRYEKIELDGSIWDSDYIMNFDEMKMSVRLDRSYLEDATSISPGFSSPAFIKLLIDKGYLVDDGLLNIDSKPLYITEDNIKIVADIINGVTKYQYPVVFVSKANNDDNPINVDACI